MYHETVGIDLTNKKITLKPSANDEIPYSNVKELRLQLFDSPGKLVATNINTIFFSDTKALFIVFDLSNEESFKGLKNYINVSKTYFGICKKTKSLKDDIIKQPELFQDVPIVFIGNKSDLVEERKVLKADIDEFIKNIKAEYNFSKISYHEISVKEDVSIEKIFQEIIFHYFQRNFEPIFYKKKQVGGNQSNQNIDKEINNELNNSHDSGSNKNLENMENKSDLILDIKEDKKENENEKKRPSLDKNIIIYNQMLDKVKKQFFNQMNNIKEQNKEEMEKLKIEFKEDSKKYYEKLNILANKNKELEILLKHKEAEIKDLKKSLDDLYSLNKDINLKFKIPDEKFKDEINIKTKGENKMIDVIEKLYKLCPYLENLKIKSFYIDGNENNKIDEMKTVNENKLKNDSMIYLII